MPLSDALPSQVDVVVVGAGLAGLACAARLSGAGLHVAVLEQADQVGGRVRTDLVDGWRCDRGFQLLNPAYPEARRVLDLTSLRLQPLPGAVVVASGSGRQILGDPRHLPARLIAPALLGDLTAAGPLRQKLLFARWALAAATRDPANLLSAPDEAWGQTLDRLGIDGALRRSVIEPFLAGTLAESDGSTSRRFVELLLRSFVRGRPSVPWDGMQAIADQLAAQLPDDAVRVGTRVEALGPFVAGGGPGREVRTADGGVSARAVVIATDPATAATFTGLPAPRVRPLTTFWHTASSAPSATGALHLDGDRRGPVVNTVVMSNAAPGYSRDGRPLVATTMLGLPSGDPTAADSEPGVRRQLAHIYGVDTSRWDLVTTHPIAQALTAMDPPLDVRQPVDLGDGLFVVGDHRDSASAQGALVSGRRGADAVLRALDLPVPPRPPLDALAGTRRPTIPRSGAVHAR